MKARRAPRHRTPPRQSARQRRSRRHRRRRRRALVPVPCSQMPAIHVAAARHAHPALEAPRSWPPSRLPFLRWEAAAHTSACACSHTCTHAGASERAPRAESVARLYPRERPTACASTLERAHAALWLWLAGASVVHGCCGDIRLRGQLRAPSAEILRQEGVAGERAGAAVQEGKQGSLPRRLRRLGLGAVPQGEARGCHMSEIDTRLP